MVQKLSTHATPQEAEKLIARLGEHIKIARKRRGLTMEEMASRMYVTRKTLSRLEKGETGVTLAVLAAALWVLGLEKELEKVALPESDAVGIFRERQRLPKRVRISKPADDLDF
jgi:transcriptional regulator with XRE-family HTH domain